MLKLTKKLERSRLHIAIQALTKLGIIQTKEEEFIEKTNDINYISARIRSSSKGFCFAVRDDGGEDIYVREKNLNQAWHGDKVLVKINREAVRRRSPEGKVLCILERSKQNVLATLREEENILYGDPLDERILSLIELPHIDNEYLEKENQNIVDIKITRYPIAQLRATGEVSRKLTLDNGLEGDLEIIKTKYNLLNESKAPNVALKQPILKPRINLQSQPCLLLKSWVSKDSPLLPAIYTEPYKGGMKVWLHVPAISERINFGSKLDDWIKDRSKSICLAIEWKNLLNEKLYEESCLQLNKANEAVTIEFILGKNGEVNSYQFYLSIVEPKNEINPSHIESLLNRKPRSRVIPAKLKAIKDSIQQLENIIHTSKLINQTLIQQGMIELNILYPDLKYLDDFNVFTPGEDYEGWNKPLNLNDPQSILSQFMKLSNIILKNHFNSYQIEHILLVRKGQRDIQINEIIKSALVLESNITVNEDGIVRFEDLIKAMNISPNKELIEKLISNTIPDAKYVLSSNYNNEDKGLIEDNSSYIETPWTSPGQSYSDIINQYILVKLLLDAKSTTKKNVRNENLFGLKNTDNTSESSIFSKSILSTLSKLVNEMVIKDLNSKKDQAKSFKLGLISMIQLRAVENVINKVIEGTITGVQSYGFFVEIEPSKAEGLVHVSSLNDDWYEYRSRQNLLIGRKNKKTFQLGDKVMVKVLKIDLLRNQIDLDINLTADNTSSIEIEEAKISNTKN
ncbi:RNB domain-containing ribonuclease [Prochlorococcus marinus]|uniref:RNB domain-containing ribonuclease n=1 Tax=Prochlorococcus marinus TaxID=1219 RepID=UPI0022B45B46|nr:RNB domain-containing ribonuclease [Prochlorococcus marinus]